jgi:hypothetical protein
MDLSITNAVPPGLGLLQGNQARAVWPPQTHVIDDINHEKGNRVIAGVFRDVVAGLPVSQDRPR